MLQSRQQVYRAVADRVTAAEISSINALLGFDGFVDQIISVVDKRHDMNRYDPCRTLDALGRRISAAAGESSNLELVINDTRLGGNGPLMATALAWAGAAVTYVGSTGYPATHPAFKPLADRATIMGISDPGMTDALEFEDGKLMLNKQQAINSVNWDNLAGRVGIAEFLGLARQATLIGMVNWTMLNFMSQIWEKMIEHVLPRLDRAGKMLFVDLADPQRRTVGDLTHALKLLKQMQGHLDVTLGLNLKESAHVADALHLPAPSDEPQAVRSCAEAIRSRLNLACVVIHPRRGAGAATASESAWFDGPFVREPRISTGAGDHFNAGFCLGRVIGLNLEESLCAGVSSSGYYVRMAQSPSSAQLAEFARELPPAQG